MMARCRVGSVRRLSRRSCASSISSSVCPGCLDGLCCEVVYRRRCRSQPHQACTCTTSCLIRPLFSVSPYQIHICRPDKVGMATGTHAQIQPHCICMQRLDEVDFEIVLCTTLSTDAIKASESHCTRAPCLDWRINPTSTVYLTQSAHVCASCLVIYALMCMPSPSSL